MTALDGSVNYPIRDCILLAGNPLIRLRPSRLFSIHMGKPLASRFGSNGKQDSVLENFITESRLPLAQIGFIYRKLYATLAV